MGTKSINCICSIHIMDGILKTILINPHPGKRDKTMELSLSRNELFRIGGDARGVVVKCNQGSLWITQPEDHRDHVLNQRERFTVNRKGLIAIFALTDTLFEVADVKNTPNPSRFNLSLGQKFSWSVKIWWDYDAR